MPENLDFITPTLMTIFGLFLDDPLLEHHEREVIRETRVSKGSANAILRKLAHLELLTRERKGRMIFYRLNISNPVVKQFKVLVNVSALHELLNHLKPNSRRIVLFGSCAQGTNVRESDTDLYILSSEKGIIKKIIHDFNQKHVRKISPIVVDVTELIRLKRDDRPLYENIERGIILWEAG